MTAASEASREPAGSTGRKRWLSAGAYSVGAMAQRAIGFVMLPVYTRAIPSAQYGALGLLVAISTATQFVFAVAMDTYITRTYFQMADDPDKRDQTLQSIWRFLVVYPVTASVFVGGLLWLPLGSSGLIKGPELFLTLVSAALNTAGSTLPLAVLRARQQLRGYLVVSAMFSLVTPVMTVIFVIVLDQGIRGWFLAATVANAMALAAGMKIVPWKPHVRWDAAALRVAIIFSLPLVPHTLAHWALQFGDRAALAGLVSDHRLGVYTLAGNMAAPLMMLVIALNQAFAPTYARAGVGAGIGSELRDIVVTQIRVVVVLTLSVALLGPPAVSILTPGQYHGARELIPWLALGYGFLGVYFIPMNGATLAAGRRALAWVATVCSAGVNIGLVYALTPVYGLSGAAAASAVGYFVLLVLIAVWAGAGANPVTYDWSRIAPPILAGAAVFVLGSTTQSGSGLRDLVVGTLWLGVFAALILAPYARRRVVRQP